MAVIAINYQLGTHAVELGRLTADLLGYRLITPDDLLAETSRRYNVTPQQLVVVDERRPYFWERLKTDSERFAAFFLATAAKEMAQDRLVIVGRSAPHMIPDLQCVLRVRFVGPFKDRAAVVAEAEKLTLPIAERRVRDHDREVRARIQTLYGVDTEDPVGYGLMVNTFVMPLSSLAAPLASAARQIDSSVSPETWSRMRDLALAAQVRAALLVHPKIGHAQIEIQCRAATVQLTGPGLVPPWDNLVDEIVRRVEGVESVTVVAEEQPITVRPA